MVLTQLQEEKASHVDMTSNPTGSSPALGYSFSLLLQGTATSIPLSQTNGLSGCFKLTWELPARVEEYNFRLQFKIPEFLLFLRLKEIKRSSWKANSDLPFLQEQLGKKCSIHGVRICSPVWDICLRVRSPKYPVLFAYFVQQLFTAKCIFCPSARSLLWWVLLLFNPLYIDRREWTNHSVQHKRKQFSKSRESVLGLGICL